MYNSYGERRLACVRVPLAGIDASLRTGAMSAEALCASGVPADAVLVDVRLYAEASDALPLALIFVYEHAGYPVVLAGLQMSEVELSVAKVAGLSAPAPSAPASAIPLPAASESAPVEPAPAAPVAE